MRADLVLTNAYIVNENSQFWGSIAIANGKIQALVFGDDLPETQEVLDLQGKILLPGLVDDHVHFHSPGRDEWEGYRSGSMAAAAGGVTTVLEMPLNCIPPTIDRIKLIEKRAHAKDQSIVDYAHWGGLVTNNLTEIPELAQAGVIGLKAFMSGAATEEFSGINDALLYAGLKQSRQLGVVIGLHAENGDVISHLEGELQSKGRVDLRAWLESRPPETEIDAIRRVLHWAEATNGLAHIVHVSVAEGVRLVAEAKTRGVNVTVETCPHFLCFDEEDYLSMGPELKCDPPVRTRAEVDALWQCVLEGLIDVIASDHAPATIEQKNQGIDNIWKAWAGITGIQTMLPAILTEGVHKRGLTYSSLVRMMSSNPARIFGLYPHKGSLQPGSDADIVVLDPEQEWQLDVSQLFNKNKHSAYEGFAFKGAVEQVIVRGKTVFLKGEILAEPGYGKLLLRSSSPAKAWG